MHSNNNLVCVEKTGHKIRSFLYNSAPHNVNSLCSPLLQSSNNVVLSNRLFDNFPKSAFAKLEVVKNRKGPVRELGQLYNSGKVNSLLNDRGISGTSNLRSGYSPPLPTSLITSPSLLPSPVLSPSQPPSPHLPSLLPFLLPSPCIA